MSQIIIGQNLVSIPFVSSTDSTRLQMSAKQIAQAVPHLNCEVPKVIGKDWRLFSETCYLFKFVAPADGEILYMDDSIMIVMLKIGPNNNVFKIFEIPAIKIVHSIFAMQLRYVIDTYKFKTGDLIYEYACFKSNIPVYGYNLRTLYLPWFGFNHEDAIVISESCAKKIRSIKAEKILIPVYSDSVFEFMYPNSKYGFIPEIGQHIKEGGLVANQIIFPNLSDLMSTDNSSNYRVEPIISKLPYGKVEDIKVHGIANFKPEERRIIHPDVNSSVTKIVIDYLTKLKKTYINLTSVFSEDYAKTLLRNYYTILNTPNKNVCYVIELLIAQDDELNIGDKLTSRYANKGVIGLILPDELMPEFADTGEKVEIIINPLSIPSRMIIGQLLENIIATIIYYTEKKIKSSSREDISNAIYKLSDLANLLSDPEYSIAIKNLANEIKTDNETYYRFMNSIEHLGLFFECSSFISNLDVSRLLEFSSDNFPMANIHRPIKIKKETFKYMKEKLRLKDFPDKDDTTYYHLTSGITYFLRLKHEAALKITARDFGRYNSLDKQPVQGHVIGGHSSKIGQMELDGLLAAGLDRVVDEIFMIKSDSMLKTELVKQILANGKFRIPNIKAKSITKMIIEAMVKALNI